MIQSWEIALHGCSRMMMWQQPIRPNSAAKIGNGKGSTVIPPPTSATWLPLLPRSPRREKYVHHFTLLRHGWMFSTIDKHGCRLKRDTLFTMANIDLFPISTHCTTHWPTLVLLVRKWKQSIEGKACLLRQYGPLGRRWCLLRRIERIPYPWVGRRWLRWCWSACHSCSHRVCIFWIGLL